MKNINNNKCCIVCNQVKPIEEFRYRWKKREIVRNLERKQCLDCFKKYRKELTSKNKESVKSKYLIDKLDNPEKYLWIAAKKRAKENNIPFNITISEIIIPEFCPILKIKIFSSINKLTNNSPSLDKINNSKGYVSGNIRVISWHANRIKSNLNKEVFSRMVNYIEECDQNSLDYQI